MVQKKSKQGFRWNQKKILIVLGLIVLATVLYSVYHAIPKSENLTSSKASIPSIEPTLDFSIWEQGNIEASSNDSPELTSQLRNYLESDPHKTELSGNDIYSVTVTKNPKFAGYQMTISFTEVGKAKLHAISKRNVGKSVVEVLNGRVIAVDKVQSPVSSGKLEISSGYKDELIASASNDLSTYNLVKNISFQYPSGYTVAFYEAGKYDRIDVYDKKEHVNNGNFYISINLGVQPNFRSGGRDEDVQELADGYRIVSKDYGNYQLDRFFKVNGGYLRAFYRTSTGLPNNTYEQIIDSIKINE